VPFPPTCRISGLAKYEFSCRTDSPLVPGTAWRRGGCCGQALTVSSGLGPVADGPKNILPCGFKIAQHPQSAEWGNVKKPVTQGMLLWRSAGRSGSEALPALTVWQCPWPTAPHPQQTSPPGNAASPARRILAFGSHFMQERDLLFSTLEWNEETFLKVAFLVQQHSLSTAVFSSSSDSLKLPRSMVIDFCCLPCMEQERCDSAWADHGPRDTTRSRSQLHLRSAHPHSLPPTALHHAYHWPCWVSPPCFSRLKLSPRAPSTGENVPKWKAQGYITACVPDNPGCRARGKKRAPCHFPCGPWCKGWYWKNPVDVQIQ